MNICSQYVIDSRFQDNILNITPFEQIKTKCYWWLLPRDRVISFCSDLSVFSNFSIVSMHDVLFSKYLNIFSY